MFVSDELVFWFCVCSFICSLIFGNDRIIIIVSRSSTVCVCVSPIWRFDRVVFVSFPLWILILTPFLRNLCQSPHATCTHPPTQNTSTHITPCAMGSPNVIHGWTDTDIVAAKPLLLIPNIFEQTDRRRRSGGGGLAANDGSASTSKRRKSHAADSMRKRSLIDSGIDLLFHKPSQQHTITSPTTVVPDASTAVDRHHHHPHRSTKGCSQDDRNKWRPFDSIKVYTERRRSHDWAATSGGELRGPATAPTTAPDSRKSKSFKNVFH